MRKGMLMDQQFSSRILNQFLKTLLLQDFQCQNKAAFSVSAVRSRQAEVPIAVKGTDACRIG